jgi:DNA invertase Pin-like site-specific DNA recombinase
MSCKIGYARVSTQDQNPELQLDTLKAAGCDPIFVDRASGGLRERPQLNAALAALRPGDTLVVWKLDRLARSLSHLLVLFEQLHAAGVGLKAIADPIDTTSSVGRLVTHILGALAEFERALIRERTMAGLAVARKNGKLGRLSKTGKRLAGHAGRYAQPKLDAKARAEIRRALSGHLPLTVARTKMVKALAQRYGVDRSTIYRVGSEAA